MSDFLIDEVLSERSFDTQNGPMVAYKVRFSGSQGNGEAETKRKAASPAPTPGETIDAELVDGKYGKELKRIYSKPGSNGSKSGEYRTPEQIMRSDAHGKAMHWCDIKVAAGEWKPITWEQYIAMVDRYYEDIKAAS